MTELGGHKGLYSTSFYPEDEFWARYNGPEYAELKRTYDPQGRLAGPVRQVRARSLTAQPARLHATRTGEHGK